MKSSNEQNKKKLPKLLFPEKYEIYKAWKVIPFIFKMQSEKDLQTKFGIDDPQMLFLCTIKNQKQFAEKHDVAQETLCDWNKRMDAEGFDYLDFTRKWAEKLTGNVVMAHYNKLIKKFDPVSGDSWYKVVAGWNEKKQVEHTGKLSILELIEQGDDDDEDQESEGGEEATA